MTTYLSVQELFVAAGTTICIALTFVNVWYAVLFERRLKEAHAAIWQSLVGRTRMNPLDPVNVIRAFRFVFFLYALGWLTLRDDRVLASYGTGATATFAAAMILVVVTVAVNGGPVSYRYP